ncbi:MAG TPA: hypothetical protein VGH38_07040 [Bryobacteraceae bacterium]
MAYSFAARSDPATVEVEDFIGAVRKAYKGNSVEAMLEVAEMFQGLAANREFLRDALIAELKRIGAERHNLGSFAPQSFIVHRALPFSLRLNLWVPPAGSARKIEQEARIYSYERAHDHNFSLLTVGAGGPGYRTRVFEYDRSAIAGYDGEPVEMTHLEDTDLPTGKAMIYRPLRDIHEQLAPDAPSMSLNLLVVEEKEIVEQPQYFFDLEKRTVLPMNENEVGRRVGFLRAVGYFADERCAGLLFDLARQSRSPSLRAAAVHAIRTGFPESEPELEELAKADGHPLVLRELQPAALQVAAAGPL